MKAGTRSYARARHDGTAGSARPAPLPCGTACETDYGTAFDALRASRHCEAYELSRCTDDPTQYVLRIGWDSAEGHMQGFRRSPEFRRFLAAIRPYPRKGWGEVGRPYAGCAGLRPPF